MSKTNFLPPAGTFFAFSLDAEATIDFYCDGVDPVARAALKAASFKTYVGFCLQSPHEFGQPSPRREFNHILVLPLQKGFTRSYNEVVLEPQMCVPIYPETRHPLRREPLVLTQFLPWSRCYIPTTNAFLFRVRPEIKEYRHAASRSMDDVIRVNDNISEDIDRLREIRGQASRQSTASFPTPRQRPQEHFEVSEDGVLPSPRSPLRLNPDYTIHRRGASDVPETPASDATYSTGTDWDTLDSVSVRTSLISRKTTKGPPIYDSPDDDPVFIPVVKIRLDFDRLPAQLPDFHELYGEYEALHAIINSANARSKEASERFAEKHPLLTPPKIRKLPGLDFKESLRWLVRAVVTFSQKVACSRRQHSQ